MNLATNNPWEPDSLVQQQFLQAHRRKNPMLPEGSLMFAVLSEATETFQKFAFSNTRRGQALFCETEKWFYDEGNPHLFSFGTICEVMGLNPGYLRRGLRQWLARGAPATSRTNRKAADHTRTDFSKKKPARQQRFTISRCRSPRSKGGWL